MSQLRIALYQPDIPGNTGTILRMAACLGLSVDIIGPAGFNLSDRALKRAGLDYAEQATLTHHVDWHAFETLHCTASRRLVLATTKATGAYDRFSYRADDILLFGRESGGVPEEVHERADSHVVIEMRAGMRSLNIAIAAAMIVGEALRQTR